MLSAFWKYIFSLGLKIGPEQKVWSQLKLSVMIMILFFVHACFIDL